MKDITKEQWEAGRPKISALDGVDFCLERLYQDAERVSSEDVGGGLSYEELIGVLLVARDELILAAKIQSDMEWE